MSQLLGEYWDELEASPAITLGWRVYVVLNTYSERLSR